MFHKLIKTMPLSMQQTAQRKIKGPSTVYSHCSSISVKSFKDRVKVHLRILFFVHDVILKMYYYFFPLGSVSVLPTVLYLLLGVLRVLVREYRGVGTETLVPGTVQALRTVLSSPMSRVEKSHHAWVQLLRCALSTLLTYWNTGTATLTLEVNVMAYLPM